MKVYYCNYENGDSVSFKTPLNLNLDDATKLFLSVSHGAENFFGIELDSGRAVQFVVEGNGRFLVDIPDNEKGGVYQKTTGASECRLLIEEVYNSGKLPPLDDFDFVGF